MDVRVSGATRPLSGSVRVPPDKSLSHRAVLFGAIAEGVSRPTEVLDSADVRSTIGAVAALGARVTVLRHGNGSLDLEIEGWGSRGPMTPSTPIDCGNSGTTARLLAGVLAGWPVDVTLTGDASLSTRPMSRVTRPLEAMGARFETADGGRLPLRVTGGALTAIEYASPVASAQVKSAVLLAGLRAPGVTAVCEPAPSRDHTERLLPAFGVPVMVDHVSRRAAVRGPASLAAYDVTVPGDPSSAAFPVAAAVIVPGSMVTLRGICLNPTRTGFLDVLGRMGAGISVTETASLGTEPVGDVAVQFVPDLYGVTVSADEVPSLIDELPVLALVATQARGTTRFEGVGELRVKESDRLQAIEEGLGAFGAKVAAGDDWLEVEGRATLRGADVSARHDHRLAMTWYVAALVAGGVTRISGFESVAVSYPGFERDMVSLGAPEASLDAC